MARGSYIDPMGGLPSPSPVRYSFRSPGGLRGELLFFSGLLWWGFFGGFARFPVLWFLGMGIVGF